MQLIVFIFVCLQSLTPNPAEIVRAVEEWMNTAQEVLVRKGRDIHLNIQRLKSLDRRRQELLIEIEDREKEIAAVSIA